VGAKDGVTEKNYPREKERVGDRGSKGRKCFSVWGWCVKKKGEVGCMLGIKSPPGTSGVTPLRTKNQNEGVYMHWGTFLGVSRGEKRGQKEKAYGGER